MRKNSHLFVVITLITTLLLTECSKEKNAYLRITSPGNGNAYRAGEHITITWESQCIAGNINEINITSVKGSDRWWTATLIKAVPNNGHTIVTLPNAATMAILPVSFGKYFKIQLVAEGGKVYAEQQGTFTINP